MTNVPARGWGGAFSADGDSARFFNITPTADSTAETHRLVLNAANSNSLYGNSTTVQPPALSLLPQIKF